MTPSEIVAERRAGRITHEQMVDALARLRFPPPERLTVPPEDLFVAEQDDPTGFEQPGTWDDVQFLRNTGVLTRDEYLDIVEAADVLRQ